MDQLLTIIQRKRRPLQTAILPEKPPTFVNCPHCGRSLTEPVKPEAEKPVSPPDKTVALETSEDAPKN